MRPKKKDDLIYDLLKLVAGLILLSIIFILVYEGSILNFIAEKFTGLFTRKFQ